MTGPRAGGRTRGAAAGEDERRVRVRARMGALYACLWVVSFTTSALVFRRRAVGRRLVPSGPVLMVVNHCSYLDIPILGCSLRRHVCFVARDTLAGNRLLAWIIARCGAILLRRDSADRAAIGAMVAHLEAGDCVAIFPEGRRSPDGRLQEFKGGAALVARRGRVPVVPVALFGTHAAWPLGGRLRPAATGVRFGEPLEPGPDVLERAREEIERLLALGRP